MRRADIIRLQQRIGVDADGVWGPVSNAACKTYFKSLMPAVNPWSKPDDRSMREFYGESGDEENLVNLSVVGLGVKYDGKPVQSIRCHKLVRESLRRILLEISNSPHAWILAEYAGCFNDRPMRGGSRPSKHSWGVAIDFDPGDNGLRTHWPRVATMPFEVMEIFAKEGWTGLGWSENRDAMHFQSTQP